MRTPFLKKSSKKGSSKYRAVGEEREDGLLNESCYDKRADETDSQDGYGSPIASPQNAEDQSRFGLIFGTKGIFHNRCAKCKDSDAGYPNDGAFPSADLVCDTLGKRLGGNTNEGTQSHTYRGEPRSYLRAPSLTENSEDSRDAEEETRGTHPDDTLSVTSVFYDEVVVSDSQQSNNVHDAEDEASCIVEHRSQHERQKNRDRRQPFPDHALSWTDGSSGANGSHRASKVESAELETNSTKIDSISHCSGSELPERILDQLVETESEEEEGVFQDQGWTSSDSDQSHISDENDCNALGLFNAPEQHDSKQSNIDPFKSRNNGKNAPSGKETNNPCFGDIFLREPLWSNHINADQDNYKLINEALSTKLASDIEVENNTESNSANNNDCSQADAFAQVVFSHHPTLSSQVTAHGREPRRIHGIRTEAPDNGNNEQADSVYNANNGTMLCDQPHEAFPLDLQTSKIDHNIVSHGIHMKSTQCYDKELMAQGSDDESIYTSGNNSMDERPMAHEDVLVVGDNSDEHHSVESDNQNVHVDTDQEIRSAVRSGEEASTGTSVLSSATRCPHCAVLEEKIMILDAQHRTELLERDLQDEDILKNMVAMKEYIEHLETENNPVLDDGKCQQGAIVKSEVEEKIRSFEEELETRATAFESTEMQARLKTLEEQNERLREILVNGQPHTDKENQELRYQKMELEEERDMLRTKIQSQEAAVALMGEEEDQLRQQIRELEQKLDVALSNSDSEHSCCRELSMSRTCHSEKAEKISSSEKSSFIVAEEDYNKEAGEGQLVLIWNLKDELAQSRALCMSQEEAIAKLVQQVQASMTMEEDEKIQVAEAARIGKPYESEDDLKVKVLELERERNRFRTKSISQERTIAKLQNRKDSFLMPPIQEDVEFDPKAMLAEVENGGEGVTSKETVEGVETHQQNTTKEKTAAASPREYWETSAEALEVEEECSIRDSRLKYLEDIIKNMKNTEGEPSNQDVSDRVKYDSEVAEVIDTEDEDSHATVRRAAWWKGKLRRKGLEITSNLLFLGKSKEGEENRQRDGILC